MHGCLSLDQSAGESEVVRIRAINTGSVFIFGPRDLPPSAVEGQQSLRACKPKPFLGVKLVFDRDLGEPGAREPRSAYQR